MASGLRFPKPEPRKAVKARADSEEAKVAREARRHAVHRDGYCRVGRRVVVSEPDDVAAGLGACDGPSEWAHLAEHRRFRTRGLPPNERHTAAGSLMMCRRHHHDYDQSRMTIEILTRGGADGPLRFRGRR